jgi:general stress protein 13
MKHKQGDTVIGQVVGLKPYGAFIKIDDELYGLLHISEVSHDFVKDINYYIHVGNKIKVKIISIDKEKNQAILSIKAMKKYGRKINRYNKTKYNAKIKETSQGFAPLAQQLPLWIKNYKEK